MKKTVVINEESEVKNELIESFTEFHEYYNSVDEDEDKEITDKSGIVKFVDEVEQNDIEMRQILKDAGTNPQAGLIDHIESLESFKTEQEYWQQYRGDYLDLRDFLKAKTIDDKKTFLKNLSKSRVILIREHLLQAWTFNPNQRDILEDQLEAISLVIYSGKDELEALEADLEKKKVDCGYYEEEVNTNINNVNNNNEISVN